MTSDGLARTAAAVQRACDQAGSVVELCRSVHGALSAAVPTDRWCGFSVDPSTLFATNGYHDEGVDPPYISRLLELEYGAVDAAQLPQLIRLPGGVATITEATGGDPASSARWREVLVPSGLAHEMRVVFRDGRHGWGAFVLLRGPDVSDFSADEVAFVRRVAPTVARGFRRVLVRQHIQHGEDAREAGIILLGGERLEIRTATSTARFWLEQLDDGGWGGELPTVVVSAARAARGGTGATALRARTRRGRWLTVTAECANQQHEDPPDVGIVIQPSRPAEIAQIMGAAHGLTNRETEVVLLIASGNTNQEIARTLGLSRYTVVDHVKSVFAKLDVASRGELTSKLFHDHYLSRAALGRPAGRDGWFLPD